MAEYIITNVTIMQECTIWQLSSLCHDALMILAALLFCLKKTVTLAAFLFWNYSKDTGLLFLFMFFYQTTEVSSWSARPRLPMVWSSKPMETPTMILEKSQVVSRPSTSVPSMVSYDALISTGLN